jgi:hypothetical protein
VVLTRVLNSPLKTRIERGLVFRFLFTFWLGEFGGSYFYRSNHLITVKHHRVKISKDTDYAALKRYIYIHTRIHCTMTSKNR